MSLLSLPLTLDGLTLKNRTVLPPMCQYSAVDGLASDYHFAHLARFALGGFGLVIFEATAVTAEGRISYADLGLWNEAQVAPLQRITAFLRSQGAASGIQLAHAGRKASTPVPWRGGVAETEAEKPRVGYQSWQPLAPSAEKHADSPAYHTPREMTLADIQAIPDAFAAAATRADRAGFDLIELHGAHGYLLNQFLSPLANHRTDAYGGARENRMRLMLEVTEAVRAVWPQGKPLIVRLSVTDAVEGGWDVDDTIALGLALKARGVSALHCSSGGFDGAVIRPGPLYQAPLAAAVRAGTGLPVIAVGLISTGEEAEGLLASGQADAVAIGRGALDDPNWPLHALAAVDGGVAKVAGWPVQSGFAVRGRAKALGLT